MRNYSGKVSFNGSASTTQLIRTIGPFPMQGGYVRQLADEALSGYCFYSIVRSFYSFSYNRTHRTVAIIQTVWNTPSSQKTSSTKKSSEWDT